MRKNKFLIGSLRIWFPIFFLYGLSASAQKLEFGIGGGVNNYRGDIAPGFHPQFSRPAGSIFFRHNISTAVSFKYAFMIGSISADDSKSSDDYAKIRNQKFTTSLNEFSLAFEYNFINYRDESVRKLGSPYLHMGLAVYRYEVQNTNKPNQNTGLQMAIPFGVGYKYVIANKWNLGLEFGARKTFTDYLDNLGGDITKNKFQNGNPHDKDMYFYTALTLSYTIYKVKCPRFYR